MTAPPAAPDPAAPAAAVAQALADTQRELRRLQRLFRCAFEHQFQFMALLDAQGRVVDYNEQFAPGARLPRDAVLGQRFWETPWFRDQPELVAQWPARLTAAHGQTRPVIHHDRFTSPDGELRWAEASVLALRDETGGLEGYVVQGTDTTEARRAEAQRAAAEQQLRDAQRLHAIGTLAGGIAHDFNNILGAIRGNLVLALDVLPADHPARTPLDQIERASVRGRALVRQVLAFSRQEPGELRIEPLQPLVEETVALLRPTLPAAVRLDTMLAPATVWARVNAAQMHQVLVNLITNARQALPASGGEIEVGLGRLPDGQGHLWVRDTGIGMDEATRRRVFEPFFTTKAMDEGTGLGLSVVHGIVMAHHGSVQVDSTPGEGTTVHVRLPAARRSGLDDDARPPTDTPSTPAPSSVGCGRRVLVLDDDEVMLALSAQLLKRSGFSVSAFLQPEQALAALTAGDAPFDAVVSDLDMPRLNGLEVIRRLRQHPPEQAVVLTSGLIDDAVRAQAAALKVHSVLHKEDLHEGLVGAVVAALDAARPPPRPEAAGVSPPAPAS